MYTSKINSEVSYWLLETGFSTVSVISDRHAYMWTTLVLVVIVTIFFSITFWFLLLLAKIRTQFWWTVQQTGAELGSTGSQHCLRVSFTKTAEAHWHIVTSNWIVNRLKTVSSRFSIEHNQKTQRNRHLCQIPTEKYNLNTHKSVSTTDNPCLIAPIPLFTKHYFPLLFPCFRTNSSNFFDLMSI